MMLFNQSIEHDIGDGVTIRLDEDGGGLWWRHISCLSRAWMWLRYKPDPKSTGHVLVQQWPRLTIGGSLLCPVAGCGHHGFIQEGRWSKS